RGTDSRQAARSSTSRCPIARNAAASISSGARRAESAHISCHLSELREIRVYQSVRVVQETLHELVSRSRNFPGGRHIAPDCDPPLWLFAANGRNGRGHRDCTVAKRVVGSARRTYAKTCRVDELCGADALRRAIGAR